MGWTDDKDKLNNKPPLLENIPDDFPDVPENGYSLFAKYSTETLIELHNARSCYICKTRFYKLHFFYDNQCPDCAALSYEKRLQGADLTNRVAVVTGGRIKIGLITYIFYFTQITRYHTVLKLLRCKATVVVTTRFPHDAAIRFAKVIMFNWKISYWWRRKISRNGRVDFILLVWICEISRV